jgi:hypothetical protein
MEDHSSDADDEITDVSGEYLSSSNELFVVPKEYCILSGSKPLSLVIRRCSIPTKEDNSPSLLRRYSNVSPAFMEEIERNSENELLNLERKVNDPHFQKEIRIPSNTVNSSSEELGVAVGPAVSNATVRSNQEVLLSSSQESSLSVVTQEYVENVINENYLHMEICATRSVENNLNLNYTVGSKILSSKSIFENCCNDRKMCERVKNGNIDNRNEYSQYLLGNSENIQSLPHALPLEHCKQKGELSVHSSFEKFQRKNIMGGTGRNAEAEGYQEMNAVDTNEYDSNIPSDVILTTDSFNVIERSESAEKINDLNLQSQFERISVGVETAVEGSVMEPSINAIHKVEEIAVNNDKLEFQSSELVFLEIQGGVTSVLDDQTEKDDELSHDTEAIMGRNSFDEEDCIVCAGKGDGERDMRIGSHETETAAQNDTANSETQTTVVSEPLLLQNTDYTAEGTTINMLHNASVVNIMRNVKEIMSPAIVEYAESSAQVENSENICPLVHTENRCAMPVGDDILVQKCEQCSFDEEELTAQSDVCSSPKNSVPSIGINGSQSPGEATRNHSVNVKAVDCLKAEVTNNSILAGELSENTMTVASADCHKDQLCFGTIKEDTSHSSIQVHNSSDLVQLCTEDALDCSYNDLSSDAVCVEHSPLLFSSDDENSYYIGKVI